MRTARSQIARGASSPSSAAGHAADLIAADLIAADLIASGAAEYTDVVRHTLLQFVEKFGHFAARIGAMDALFEARTAAEVVPTPGCHGARIRSGVIRSRVAASGSVRA